MAPARQAPILAGGLMMVGVPFGSQPGVDRPTRLLIQLENDFLMPRCQDVSTPETVRHKLRGVAGEGDLVTDRKILRACIRPPYSLFTAHPFLVCYV
jgi:hypothetical protein